jgi:hypothetical protein
MNRAAFVPNFLFKGLGHVRARNFHFKSGPYGELTAFIFFFLSLILISDPSSGRSN